MKHFYLSSKNTLSGICKYSWDFYKLILKERNYIFIDSNGRVSDILSMISSQDHVHIEIGIFQKKEIELLFLMLKANYAHVTITLHDAPLIKYPFYEFRLPLLNNLSKLYEIYANSLGAATPYVKRIKAIYVLTRKGVDAVKTKYGVDQVFYMPHVIDPEETRRGAGHYRHFVYFGFIGKNKGVEYSLRLHREILHKYPEVNFYVIGKPLGNQVAFYESMQKKYTHNVHYLGYLEESRIDEVFEKASYAILPFNNYRFLWPVSGSILYSLKKGKIVFTNCVNSTDEIIENGKTGSFLKGDIKADGKQIMDFFNNNDRLQSMQNEVYNYVATKHFPEAVKSAFHS